MEQTCADSGQLPQLDLPLLENVPSEGALVQICLRSSSGLSGKRVTTSRRCRESSGGPDPSGPAIHTPGLRLPWPPLGALPVSRQSQPR